MKKIIILSFFSLLFLQCNSIKEHNAHLNDLIPENDLKADVDFTYRKLQRLHPKLYWYISKKELDYKFDSLKSSLVKPMTSFEFYKKISPVIASIRQGHLGVYPSTKIITEKEKKELTKKGVGPFSQFEFDVFNDKLYVIKNKSYDKSIKLGSEVVAVNGQNTTDLLKEYSKWYTSDGFNQTYKRNTSGRKFSIFYTSENGVQDCVNYDLKYKDSLKTVTIKQKVIGIPIAHIKKIKQKPTPFEKAKKKADDFRKSVFGYDSISKTYNRNLKFIEKDSSIAVMKIKSFMIGRYRTFYEESFGKIDYHKSKTLILDLRNNGGGQQSEIIDLYSYLADSSFVFLDKTQVASKTSLLSALKNQPVWLKILFAPFYPFTYFKVHKEQDGKYYYPSYVSKLHKTNPFGFKGKIYVLINGGCFSASSIISSNLKGSKRATFVGEETGGDYNGTVAGLMPAFKLPNSGIKIRIGLMLDVPHYKTNIEGHGIFPDKEIIPTLEDKINGKDPEMNWILEDIRNNSTISNENKSDKDLTLKQ
jgi:C-terminal processing protease CtpA/Prc